MIKNKLWNVKRKTIIWEDTNVVASTREEAVEIISAGNNNWKQTNPTEPEYSLGYYQILNWDVDNNVEVK